MSCILPHPDLSLSQRGMLEAGCLVSSLGEHPDTSIQGLMEGGVSLAKQHYPPASLLNFQIFRAGEYCSIPLAYRLALFLAPCSVLK